MTGDRISVTFEIRAAVRRMLDYAMEPGAAEAEGAGHG